MEHQQPSRHFVVVPVSCPVPDRAAGAPKLVGKCKVLVRPDSIAFHILQQSEIFEEYLCNFESNPEYHVRLEAAGLQISGWGENGEARIVDIPGHPFYLATQFLPQMSSTRARPHPLIVAYIEAARTRNDLPL